MSNTNSLQLDAVSSFDQIWILDQICNRLDRINMKFFRVLALSQLGSGEDIRDELGMELEALDSFANVPQTQLYLLNWEITGGDSSTKGNAVIVLSKTMNVYTNTVILIVENPIYILINSNHTNQLHLIFMTLIHYTV